MFLCEIEDKQYIANDWDFDQYISEVKNTVQAVQNKMLKSN